MTMLSSYPCDACSKTAFLTAAKPHSLQMCETEAYQAFFLMHNTDLGCLLVFITFCHMYLVQPNKINPEGVVRWELREEPGRE